MAGTITFPGIGSGFDGSGIAKAAADQLRLTNEIHNTSLTRIQSENTALDRLRSLLTDLADKLSAVNTLSGGAMLSTASSSDTDVVTVSAGSGAQAGSYTVNVVSLASAATGSFERNFSSGSETVLSDAADSGTLVFTVGAGDDAESFSVAVGPTTTADELVENFNQAADGKASARLINMGTAEAPAYKIAFYSAKQGTAEGTISVEAGNQALLGENGLGGAVISQAANAVFTVSGIEGSFTRSTNNVSDAIAGVSFALHAEGTAQISVTQSASLTANQMEAFVSSFNALVRYVNEEDRVEVTKQDGEQVNVFHSLSQSSIDDQAMSEIRAAISSASSTDGSVSLASLGISTQRDGTLKFDRQQFEDAFEDNAEGAAQAFSALADRLTGTSGTLHGFTGYGLAIDQAQEQNNEEISRLNKTIEDVERQASAREDAILKQFTSLEGLLAKLNADSGYIANLLQF